MKVFIIGFCLLAVAYGHIIFQTMIPNGARVPNPCGSGYWGPVGHYSPTTHTIQKNPFGLAFKAAQFTWTTQLCRADSDGDGMSNGEELGDPNCEWTAGAAPTRVASGHPGICEPLGTTRCAGEVYSCGCHGHACVGK